MKCESKEKCNLNEVWENKNGMPVLVTGVLLHNKPLERTSCPRVHNKVTGPFFPRVWHYWHSPLSLIALIWLFSGLKHCLATSLLLEASPSFPHKAPSPSILCCIPRACALSSCPKLTVQVFSIELLSTFLTALSGSLEQGLGSAMDGWIANSLIDRWLIESLWIHILATSLCLHYQWVTVSLYVPTHIHTKPPNNKKIREINNHWSSLNINVLISLIKRHSLNHICNFTEQETLIHHSHQ